jgi:uncharacterized protein with GYD domain
MTTFVMLGKMSGESIKEISPKRTVDALALIKKYGGELKSGYVMLGKYDLIMILELPNKEQAIKTSVGLSQMLGITFTTSPAITFEEFDKLMVED